MSLYWLFQSHLRSAKYTSTTPRLRTLFFPRCGSESHFFKLFSTKLQIQRGKRNGTDWFACLGAIRHGMYRTLVLYYKAVFSKGFNIHIDLYSSPSCAFQYINDDCSPQCMTMYDYFLSSFRSSSSNGKRYKEEKHYFQVFLNSFSTCPREKKEEKSLKISVLAKKFIPVQSRNAVNPATPGYSTGNCVRETQKKKRLDWRLLPQNRRRIPRASKKAEDSRIGTATLERGRRTLYRKRDAVQSKLQ